MILSREMAINILTAQKERFLDEYVDYGNVANAYDMAIDCLKAESEPVKPIAEKAMLDYQSWHYICGDCGGQIDIQDNYCRHCGRVVAHLSNRI